MVRYAFSNNREAGDAFNTSGLADASARGSTFTSDSAILGRRLRPCMARTRSETCECRRPRRTRYCAATRQPGRKSTSRGWRILDAPFGGINERHDVSTRELTRIRGRGAGTFGRRGRAVNRVRIKAERAGWFWGRVCVRDARRFPGGRARPVSPGLWPGDGGFSGDECRCVFAQDHWSVTRRDDAGPGRACTTSNICHRDLGRRPTTLARDWDWRGAPRPVGVAGRLRNFL